MVNHAWRLTIIRVLRCVTLLLLLSLFMPKLIHHADGLHQLQVFLNQHQLLFMLVHGFFYMLLFFLWPTLIQFTLRKQHEKVASSQITLALSARWYLLGVLMVFELLTLAR